MGIEFIGYRLVLAFLIGAAIGLEREIHEQTGEHENKPSAILGIRTFSLVAVLGAITGILYTSLMPFALLIGACFFSLLIIFYILDAKATNSRGITTEIGLIYSYLIGALLITDVIPAHVTLALSVGLILMLSQKAFIKSTVRTIRSHELNAFISFSIIALAILPFLPNQAYTIKDIPGLSDLLSSFGLADNAFTSLRIINPFKTWLYVALITGVDLIGYFLERILGQKKGWLVASAAGGFVSSTATTQSLAQESKNHKKVNHLVAAAIAANLVSFVQIFILLAPINGKLAVSLIPTILLMIATAGGGLLFLLSRKEEAEPELAVQKEAVTKIIDLQAALRFAGLFVIISIISQVALILFGNSGFLVATALGAIIGLDAVMINTAQLVGVNITISTAILAFIIANAVNIGAKTFYSYTAGAKLFTLKFGISMAAVIAASILGFTLTTGL